MKKGLFFVLLFYMIFCCNVAAATETTDFDVVDFEETMAVGSSQTISVTIYPEETENKPTYESSNIEVAEISQGGKITAKKKGTANILITVGKVKKTLPLTVIVETEEITLNGQYVMLKKGERFQIKAEVLPKDAEQELTYKSTDADIAKVNSKGKVTGIKNGAASIIVSNGRMSTSITVIVNQNVYTESLSGSHDTDVPEIVLDEESIESKIRNSKSDEIHFYASEVDLIDEKVLYALQETEKRLVIKADRYEMTLAGKDIINCENVLTGGITLRKADIGTKVVINGAQPLPGKVRIRIKDDSIKGFKYVYLKDSSQSRYQFLDAKGKGDVFFADIAGEYYLTFEKLNQFKIEIWHVVLSILAIVFLICIYIIVKRKYWFW